MKPANPRERGMIVRTCRRCWRAARSKGGGKRHEFLMLNGVIEIEPGFLALSLSSPAKATRRRGPYAVSRQRTTTAKIRELGAYGFSAFAGDEKEEKRIAGR